MGSPIIFSTDFVGLTVAGAEIQRRVLSSRVGPGFFVPLGRDTVSLEITKNNDSSDFAKFKNDPTLKRYRHAVDTKTVNATTTKDFVAIFRLCLAATESAEGKKFDPDAFQVEAPNYFAVIDQKKGFSMATQATVGFGRSLLWLIHARCAAE
jgi:hypothetical protein